MRERSNGSQPPETAHLFAADTRRLPRIASVAFLGRRAVRVMKLGDAKAANREPRTANRAYVHSVRVLLESDVSDMEKFLTLAKQLCKAPPAAAQNDRPSFFGPWIK